jgi:proliferating cell nuclear antigen PCNA
MSTILKAKSREGFAVKILTELLSNQLKFPPFKINEKGIHLRATDQHRDILIDLDLPRENFTIFKCPKPLSFVINSSHFYRLLKTIKKKDSITLFISEQRPMQLGICVEQNDENSDKVTTYINITYVQPEEIELPEGYNQPIIVTSKHFQKLKTLHSIGNEMKVTIVGNSVIKFFVNGKNLFSREISIGENDEEDAEEEEKTFTQTFTTSHITQLTKCAGQSGNIQIYHHEELPLHLKMRTGTLGTLSVYIKSHELIEQLEEETDTEQFEDISNPLGQMLIEEST